MFEVFGADGRVPHPLDVLLNLLAAASIGAAAGWLMVKGFHLLVVTIWGATC
jgi:hypothetical protein